MKFATFAQRGLTAYGAIADQGIIDLSSRHGNTWPTLKHVIEDTALPRLTDLAATLNPDFATTCITFRIQSTFPTATPNTKMGKTHRPICRCSRASRAALPATINR